MLRRVVAVTVLVAAALTGSAPAFADGLGGIRDLVNNACQNVTDGPGSCPHI